MSDEELSGPLPDRGDFPFVGPNLKAEEAHRDKMKTERLKVQRDARSVQLPRAKKYKQEALW